MVRKHAHCGFCGVAFAADQAWPRQCTGCREITYRNPLPVVVALLPVDAGLLAIRRTIEPRRGEIALPGGFLEDGESWQAGCVRELFEETGVVVPADEVSLFQVLSPSPPVGVLLIFGLMKPRKLTELPAFNLTNETGERLVIDGPHELAFPTHTQAVREYFSTARSR